MNLPRLLIPITYQFSVRYILRTGLLSQLLEFCQPVVALCWHDAGLEQEFVSAGTEIYLLPETAYGSTYLETRRQVEMWHHDYRLKSVTTAIDFRRREASYPWHDRLQIQARRLKYRLNLLRPGAAAQLLVQEDELMQQDTNLAEFAHFLTQCRPDAILSVTPYHRQEELLLRAAVAANIPLCTSIISFDNVTTRGWMSVTFDRYLVWNQYNEQEIRRAYPAAADRPIDLVGPAQFDFYWQPEYLWSEKNWRTRLGLPQDRPVILFGGGPKNIAPHEPHLLRQLDQAIHQGKIRQQPVILFRRHPMDPDTRWQGVRRETHHVVYDDPWQAHQTIKYSNIQRDDIAKLTSTLKYSAVHINTSSTMTLDGAVFDRPQIGPAYDDQPGQRYHRICRELYEREHFLPISKSGGLAIVNNRDQMVTAVCEALEMPERYRAERRSMLEDMCTYFDGSSTSRVAQGVRTFLEG